MLLTEFFGRAIALGKKSEESKDDSNNHADDVFWYILDHDKLHKDCFMPIGRKMHKDNQAGEIKKNKYLEQFMPMVEKGCMEYYHKNKLKGKPAKHFPKEFRNELCERLCDHYIEAVKNNEFQLGD